MNKFRFHHEKSKKERGIENHVSTPSDLAQLLTQLLGIEKAEGKIIYDCCFGIGALSKYVNTEKNILIGDDQAKEYLEQGQKNIPKAILFNHDVLACQKTVPCWEHLISKEFKEKVEKYLEQIFGKDLKHFRQLAIIRGKSSEEIKKTESQARQIMLEWLINQELQNKNKEF